MNRLPQTKDEYRDLRQHYKIMSKDQGLDGVMQKEHGREKEPPIAPMVENLLHKNLKQKTVQDQLVDFFRAYDDFKEDQILKLQLKVDKQKQKNKKLRNKQAGAFSDKSEIENLFLDCVDENRKEVLKLFTNSYAQ